MPSSPLHTSHPSLEKGPRLQLCYSRTHNSYTKISFAQRQRLHSRNWACLFCCCGTSTESQTARVVAFSVRIKRCLGFAFTSLAMAKEETTKKIKIVTHTYGNNTICGCAKKRKRKKHSTTHTHDHAHIWKQNDKNA